ncbi:hypothetical protein FQR65_LT17068 [Abscondita terminalis]|nr:hypothetical protein FQR65_LT17068 [Abscondita terminalis]
MQESIRKETRRYQKQGRKVEYGKVWIDGVEHRWSAHAKSTVQPYVKRYLTSKFKINYLQTNERRKIQENPENWEDAESIYDFTAKSLKGETVPLKNYKGNVCLIVNVASRCGYTKKNYAELVELHEKYADDKGLRILAFPCNQFGKQEPGDADKICNFVEARNVKFDMFEKVNVNGDDAHPLWKYLKSKLKGDKGVAIKWNFTKFIIDSDGQPVERFASNKSPLQLVEHLEKYCYSVQREKCHCTEWHRAIPKTTKTPSRFYEFTANNIKGEPVSMDQYKGHVSIIVNVASQCGYTQNHYEELNELYEKYGEEKVKNGGSEEICSFVSKRNVKFDLFEKIDVNGSNTHPLWKYLKYKQGGTLGDFIKWNFTKFVVDKDGQPVGRYGPNTSPKAMVPNLEKYW